MKAAKKKTNKKALRALITLIAKTKWRVFIVLSPLFISGCGMMDGATMNNNDHYDGGPNIDGGGTCEIALSLKNAEKDSIVDTIIPVIATVEYGTLAQITWKINDPDESELSDFDLRDNDRTMEFSPENAGTYTVNVEAETVYEKKCSAMLYVTVFPESYNEKAYTVRLTPPDTKTIPRQEKSYTVIGATPRKDLGFDLQEGTPFTFKVEDETSQPIRSFVRLKPFLSEDGLSQEGFFLGAEDLLEFMVEQNQLFNVLIIPEVEDMAPLWFDQQTPGQNLSFALDQGQVVIGHIFEATNTEDTPLGDVQVVLRCKDTPSSVGKSRSFDGEFLLYGRPGMCGLQSVPSPSSVQPNLHIEPSQRIEITEEAATRLEIVYNQIPRADYSGTVVDEETSPVQGALITLISEPLISAASLTTFLDDEPQTTYDASGYMKKSFVTPSNGTWSIEQLPQANYEVIIQSSDGSKTVLTNIDLTQGSISNSIITLKKTASVTGTVRGAPGALGDEEPLPLENVRVVASTRLGRGSSVETYTDASGFFELSLVDGAKYTFSFFPPVQTEWARLVNMEATVTDGLIIEESSGQDIQLPQGLSLEGRVRTQSSGSNVSSVLIQVFDSQTTNRIPVFETMTNASGKFKLILPDPGRP